MLRSSTRVEESRAGIYSKHSLDDPTVYNDDIIVHQSDQDFLPYYRKMDTLEDTTKMDDNCKDAQSGQRLCWTSYPSTPVENDP